MDLSKIRKNSKKKVSEIEITVDENDNEVICEEVPPTECYTPDLSSVSTSRPMLQQTTFTNTTKTNIVSNNSNSLDDVVAALSKLNSKFDDMSGRYARMEVEYFQEHDKETKSALENMRNSKDIHDLISASGSLLEFFYDEKSGDSLIRCNPCFKMNVAAKPALSSYTSTEASSVEQKRKW